MRKVIIDPICTPEEARQRFAGLRPDYQWAASQGLNFVRGEDFCCRDTKGKLVAMLLTDMFSEEEQAHHWEIYKDIKGSAEIARRFSELVQGSPVSGKQTGCFRSVLVSLRKSRRQSAEQRW